MSTRTVATNPNFDPEMTRRAVSILRNVEGNVEQARGEAGDVEEGEACATAVLYYFLDDLRDDPNQYEKLTEWLPISADAIVSLNDTTKLSFSQIAGRIADAAGLD